MLLQLFHYEIKKLFSLSYVKKAILLFLIANMVICGFYVKNNRSVSAQMQPYLDKVYALYEKDPDFFYSEYKRILKEREDRDFNDPRPENIYGNEYYTDLRLFKDVYNIIHADTLYHEKIGKIIEQAEGIKSNYEVSSFLKNTYGYRYQTQVIEVYTELNENVRLGDRQIKGWNELFSYRSDYFLIIVLIGIFTVLIGHSDKKNDFYGIAGVYYFGRTATVIAKYLAAVLLSIVTVLVFAVSNVAVVGALCGYSSPGSAAQAIQNLSLFPYGCSILAAYGYGLLIRTLGAIMFASVVFAFTIIGSNYYTGMCVGVLAAVFGYSLQKSNALLLTQWKELNFYGLYSIDHYIARFRTVNVLDYSVNLNVILVIMGIAVIAVALAVSVICYPLRKPHRRKSSRLSFYVNGWKEKFAGIRKRKWYSSSLIYYEFRKNAVLYILLVLMLLLKLYVSANYFQYEDSSKERIYKQYLEQIGGEYSEEKQDYLENELKRCKEIISNFSSMEESYWNNEITTDAFHAYVREYNAARIQEEVLGNLIKQAVYFDDLYKTKGILGSFVYETGYNKLIYQEADWILIVLTCAFACRLYLVEFEKNVSGSNMYTITQTTAYGRSVLFSKKMLLCLAVTGGLWIVFGAIDWVYLLRSFEMPDISASLLSIMAYRDMQNQLSIGAHLVITEILSLLGTVIVVCMCVWVSIFVKNSVATYTIVSTVVAVPYFAANTDVEFCRYVDLTMLFHPEKMCRQFSYGYSGFYFCLWVIVAVGVYLLAIKTVRKGV